MAKDKSKKTKAEPEVEVKAKKKGKKPEAETPTKASKKGKKPAVDDDDFDDLDPSAGSGSFRMTDHVGEHMLIIPTGFREGFKTSNGPTDTVVADVVILNLKKPAKSEIARGALIFQTVLVDNLRDKVGKGKLAAKLIMGEAKNGNSAPYLFERSDEAKTAARAWLDANGPDLD